MHCISFKMHWKSARSFSFVQPNHHNSGYCDDLAAQAQNIGAHMQDRRDGS